MVGVELNLSNSDLISCSIYKILGHVDGVKTLNSEDNWLVKSK